MCAPPGTHPVLTPDDVHVWFASLERTEDCTARLTETLSPDERHRADRFRFERDRRHFSVARGLLRTILGDYLGVNPDRVAFRYGRQGKPALAGAFESSGVHFNLSHGHGRSLYAVALRREVGVDLERVRPLGDEATLAERFFSAREKTALRALPGAQRIQGFFNCWTRKEAYVKATGDGLSCPLDRFHVSLIPGEPARILEIDGDPHGPSRWWMQALEPEPGYVGAVVAELTGRPLAVRQCFVDRQSHGPRMA
jgi:4'-phosphopantetheinyl transferase